LPSIAALELLMVSFEVAFFSLAVLLLQLVKKINDNAIGVIERYFMIKVLGK
jgi:hypothetical protein